MKSVSLKSMSLQTGAAGVRFALKIQANVGVQHANGHRMLNS